MGTVFPDWDNGRGLGVVYGEDSFRKLTPEELLEEQQKEDINQDTGMGMNMGMSGRFLENETGIYLFSIKEENRKKT
ncbi:MAG: DUF4314 domain-containing protein [Enterocloster sp.]